MSRVQESPAADRVAAQRAAYRTILVHVQTDEAASFRLAAAIALSRSIGATLIGLGAEMVQPALFADPFGVGEATWLVEARKLVEENLTRAQALFEEAARDLPRTWLKVREFPVDAMQLASGEADLLVAGATRTAKRDGYRSCDPAELAIKSGRPVLVVPDRRSEVQFGRILIGWKNTREARRAVADALPFLKAAEEVLVLTVDEAGDDSGVEMQLKSLVRNLRRHGVTAKERLASSSSSTTGSQLLEVANEMDADLIVSGAYGHTRLGEWAFGGVTRTLLETGERPLLISH